MRYLRTLSCVICLFALTPVWAQFGGLGGQVNTPVTWEEQFVKDSEIAEGDEIELAFEAVIQPGYWVYSAVPSEGNPGAATSFHWDDTATGVETSGSFNEEGDPKKYYDEIFETDMVKYLDKVVFKQKVRINEIGANAEGYIRYQVCNEELCIPNEYSFAFAPKVVAKKKNEVVTEERGARKEDRGVSEEGKGESDEGRGASKEEENEGRGAKNEEGGEETRESPASVQEASSEEKTGKVSDEPIQTQRGSSLWKLMLEGFLFGLASVLTPCIFPMIPLTVSYFTKRQGNRGKGIRDAVFYGLSIVAIYTVLAMVLSAIFGPDTMQRVAIHPAFNLAFFGLLVIFALSFMGMFELTLPSSWSTAASKGSERGGLGGVFLMALALAIVSFSCTGPIVATALGDAFANGNYGAPTLTMLSFSTALALPFVLFAVFPGWLEGLPKSGGWLNAVKVTLGLLELALAFIYLSRADLVMNWHLLSREAFIGAWIVIFGVLGFYLLGKIHFPHDSKVERLPVPRALLGMSSLWFVLYLFPGLWGAPLNMLGGYLPPNNENTGVLLQEGQAISGTISEANDICNYPNKSFAHLNESTPRGFCAFYDLDQGMAYAQESQKPVFLDFTGHTCANCRFLEQNAWVDPQIQSHINEDFVLVSLYTDDRQKLPQTELTETGKKLRTVGDKWLQYQIDQYVSNAQPFYVLLDHAGAPLLPPIGYNPPLNLQEYRDYFQKGLEVFAQRQGA